MPPKKAEAVAAAPAGLDHAVVLSTIKTQLTTRSAAVLEAEAAAAAAEARSREHRAALAAETASAQDVVEELKRSQAHREAALHAEISVLQAEIAGLRADAASTAVVHADAAVAAEAALDARDREVIALKEQMGEIVGEFGDMLAALLQRLGERAELVVPSVDGAGVSASVQRQVKMLARMRELSGEVGVAVVSQPPTAAMTAAVVSNLPVVPGGGEITR